MSDDLQFEKVEYASGAAQCASCSRALGSPWWQAGAVRVCSTCKAGMEQYLGTPIGAAGYVRATAAGLGTAIACAVVWAVIEELTGYQLGIVAIGVGWAIGEVVRRVAGRGSRMLQVIGLLLVYLAISLAAIPQVLGQTEEGGAVAWIVAILISFAFPFLVWMEGASAFLWYLIVFFGFRRVWSALAAPNVQFEGPFTT